MKENRIRTLFSRQHDIVIPRLGVFLAGPTPPDGQMKTAWRRRTNELLLADNRLTAKMIVVSPEPESGRWSDIDKDPPANETERIRNKQIPWEWQYLKLCDLTAFWLPTYWRPETAGEFAPNIGPTSRWEFGFYLQEYLKNPTGKHFIVGGPEDAESVKWARKICAANGIKWHSLKKEEKGKLVADSFVREIADTLCANDWEV